MRDTEMKFRRMMAAANQAARTGQPRNARRIRKDALTWLKLQAAAEV